MSSRCMEHAVHLAASHFMQKIAPSSVHKLLKKAKEVTKNTGIDEDLNLDELDIDLAFNGNGNNYEDLNTDSGGDADDSDTHFDVADAIGKALALVMQVSCHSYYNFIY